MILPFCLEIVVIFTVCYICISSSTLIIISCYVLRSNAASLWHCSAVCCLLKSFIRQWLFYISSEVRVGLRELSWGVVSICLIAQNLLPEFHFYSQMVCDKRDSCLCIIHLRHIARTRNCIWKYNFKVPGETQHSPRMTRMFPGCMDNVCYISCYKILWSVL